MGRLPKYLGSSLFRLSIVRLYDQRNITSAHDKPIAIETLFQDRTYGICEATNVQSALSDAGTGVLWSEKVSNTIMGLMGHSVIVSQNVV